MPRLYDWGPGDDSITIDDKTIAFIRMSGHALETIANHWWARYLKRVNMLAPLIIEKVERNGAERGSLAKYVKLLRVTDRTQCFYCERPIDDGATPHVDHVIPWSFLLSDPLWDLSCFHVRHAISPNPMFYLMPVTSISSRRSPWIAGSAPYRSALDRRS